MKSINIKDLTKDIDPFTLFSKGITLCYDQEKKKYNPMTIGWGTIGILWSKPVVIVFIHKTRYSKHLFDKESKFSVCFLSNKYNEQIALFGSKSGRDMDKIKESNLDLTIENDYAYFNDSELVIKAKKIGQTDFDKNHIDVERIKKWYDQDGVHTIYIGEIEEVLKK